MCTLSVTVLLTDRLNGSDCDCYHVQPAESRLLLVHEVAPPISESYPRQQLAVGGIILAGCELQECVCRA